MRQRRRRQIKLPMTLRQAQKLFAKKKSQGLIIDALNVDLLEGINDKDAILAMLARMAARNPEAILIDQDGKSKKENIEKTGADSPSAEPSPLTIENCEESKFCPQETDGAAPQSESDQDGVHGDGNSCESAAQTSSQENAQSQLNQPPDSVGLGDGEPQDGSTSRSAGDAPHEQNGSETEKFTSGDFVGGGTAQNSNLQVATVPSTALRNEQRSEDTNAIQPSAQPRDADAQESGDSQTPSTTDDLEGKLQAKRTKTGNGDEYESWSSTGEDAPQEAIAEGNQPGVRNEDRQGQAATDLDSKRWGKSFASNKSRNQVSDDRPTHQKKWGKQFSAAGSSKLSASANSNYGGVTAELRKFGVSASLLKLCRQRLAALVGDSTQNYGPRWDYQKFCERIQTYRNPFPARKEEEGRPVILVMADVSGSCSSFSEQSVAVAKACSKLGVPGADVLVLTHSNGYPTELKHNGKPVPIESIHLSKSDEHDHANANWYEALLNRFQIQVAITLGDWDAANDYAHIAQYPTVERFLWLDNAHCSSRGTVLDRTKMALSRFKEQSLGSPSRLRHKMIYKDGCQDVIAFIENIKT